MKAGGLYGSVEAGGTKFVCAVGAGPDSVADLTVIPTETPEATIRNAIAFFKNAENRCGPLRALGVCSFGPIDLRRGSSTYGCITSTPKPGWRNTDIVGAFKAAFAIPVGFDTDVNGAALGEARWGAARGKGQVLYVTVGTGIGGGALASGRPVHGLLHPEMGHIRIPHDLLRDPYPGCCPYHGDCLEGLACGVAIDGRWGKSGAELAGDERVWDLEAEYLAAGIVNLSLTLSPEVVIIGGGVMRNGSLYPKIRSRAAALFNRYIAAEPVLSRMDEYIVPPGLGERAGIAGGFVLAAAAG